MPKLTNAIIDRIPPPEMNDVLIWDSDLKGFGIRIKASGVRTYFVNYRNESGRLRRLSIGQYDTLSPTEARRHARKLLGRVSLGQDPAESRSTARSEPTFRDIAEEYIKTHCGEKKSGKEDERIVRKDLIPVWKNIRAKDLRRRDVIALTDSIKERGAGIMANRTLAVIRRLYNHAISRDLVEINPTILVRPPAKEASRERVLDPKEIRTLWTRLDKMLGVTMFVPAALRLILLTAQRPGEIVNAEWSEIDLESRLWEIPGGKTKNARPHRVPLSLSAVEILRSIPRFGHHVFPARVGTGLDADRNMDPKALAHAIRRNRSHLGMDPFTPHDLRRTAASQMAGMGVGRLTISKVLNHVERGVTAVYDRYSYDEEKRTALNAWAEKLSDIVEGREGKVIPLAR
jgi:integrase